MYNLDGTLATAPTTAWLRPFSGLCGFVERMIISFSSIVFFFQNCPVEKMCSSNVDLFLQFYLNAIATYGSLSILNLKQCSLTNKKSIKKSLGLAKYPQVLLVSPHSARGISHYQGLRIPKGARRFPISGRSQLPALTGC